jgi:hypothetical protein
MLTLRFFCRILELFRQCGWCFHHSVRGIDCASFYDFSAEFWNCSDSVVFSGFFSFDFKSPYLGSNPYFDFTGFLHEGIVNYLWFSVQ